MRIRWLVIAAIISAILFVVSQWQIEYIITCADNGWEYDAPFHLFQTDIWTAHDIWYTVLWIAWILTVADIGVTLFVLNRSEG